VTFLRTGVCAVFLNLNDEDNPTFRTASENSQFFVIRRREKAVLGNFAARRRVRLIARTLPHYYIFRPYYFDINLLHWLTPFLLVRQGPADAPETPIRIGTFEWA
jgi:hypothetical protein